MTRVGGLLSCPVRPWRCIERRSVGGGRALWQLKKRTHDLSAAGGSANGKPIASRGIAGGSGQCGSRITIPLGGSALVRFARKRVGVAAVIDLEG